MAFVSFSALSTPSQPPASVAQVCAWHGNYLAVGCNHKDDGIMWFRRDGNSLTRLPAPPQHTLSAFGGVIYGCAWDGDFLAVSHHSGSDDQRVPWLAFYKKVGETLQLITGYDPPGGPAFRCAWGGNYLAVTHWYGSGVSYYRRDGDSLTKIAGTGGSNGKDVAWSGNYLAAVFDNSPFARFYRRDGDSIVFLSNITLPWSGRACAWNGDYLAIGHTDGNKLSFYKRNGNSLTKLANPTIPAGEVMSLNWAGDFLIVGVYSSPYVQIYHKPEGQDSLVKLTDPSPLAAFPQFVGSSKPYRDGDYMAFYVAAGLSGSPWLSLNKLLIDEYTATVFPATISQSLSIFNPIAWVDAPLQVPHLPLDLDIKQPSVGISVKKIIPVVSLPKPTFFAPHLLVVPSPNFAGKTIYDLTLTGSANGLDDLVLPMMNFQGRLRNATPSYLQVVVPNAPRWADAIMARINGQIVVRKGVEFLDGGRQMEEIARVNLNRVADDRGGNNQSITLSGHRTSTAAAPKARPVEGLTYRHSGNGQRRYRCRLDPFLRPGDTAIIPEFGEQITVGMISYVVDPSQETMEISEA